MKRDLNVSRKKPTPIIMSLSNFIKKNHNTSGLVSVVLSGMFKYSS